MNSLSSRSGKRRAPPIFTVGISPRLPQSYTVSTDTRSISATSETVNSRSLAGSGCMTFVSLLRDSHRFAKVRNALRIVSYDEQSGICEIRRFAMFPHYRYQ